MKYGLVMYHPRQIILQYSTIDSFLEWLFIITIVIIWDIIWEQPRFIKISMVGNGVKQEEGKGDEESSLSLLWFSAMIGENDQLKKVKGSHAGEWHAKDHCGKRVVPYWGVLWPACSTRLCAALFIFWVVYTCRLCIVPLVGGGVGCWQPREGPAAVVLRLPPGHRAETQAPDGGGRRFHQGGREGGHPPRSSAWYTPGHPSPCAWRT